MSDTIWVGAFSPTQFDKVGLRHKYFGQPWEAPYVSHVVPQLDPAHFKIMERYERGLPVSRDELPEASAVYDAKGFAKQKAVSRARYCYIVDETLAALLAEFDMGPGGVIDYPIYRSDESTPIDARWSILGLGGQKRSFNAAQSTGFKTLLDGKGQKDSVHLIKASFKDEDFAFSEAALDGPDMWAEAELWNCFGFSNRLGQALVDNGYKNTFGLRTARIV